MRSSRKCILMSGGGATGTDRMRLHTAAQIMGIPVLLYEPWDLDQVRYWLYVHWVRITRNPAQLLIAYLELDPNSDHSQVALEAAKFLRRESIIAEAVPARQQFTRVGVALGICEPVFKRVPDSDRRCACRLICLCSAVTHLDCAI